MSRPDVLFVKPGSQKGVYGKTSDFGLTAFEPPLWASLLAGFLRVQGYAVEVCDAEVEGLSHAATADRIRAVDPLLVVIAVSGSNPSASTMNMTGSGQILKHLREAGSGTGSAQGPVTLLQGLHPSYLPERTLREEAVDHVCQGEGFLTLPPLLDALRAGKRGHLKIPGLWTVQGGVVLSNPRPAPWSDLDALPMPAWDLLPMKSYRAHNWHCFDDITKRQPYGIIYTSLGCPFDCSFCCINSLFGKRGIRYRSPARVVEEIDFLVSQYGIRNIKIIDEMFVLKESHVLELCDRIIERGYDLNMWAYARTNTVKPHLLARMKQAGIHWVAYGFEAGNKRVLQAVNKAADLEATSRAIEMTYREGLYIVANFIFGLPGDDWESMQDSLNMALEINAEWGNFYCTMAYPGSRIFDEAVANGTSLPATWQGYSQYSIEALPLPTEQLTSGEILSFRDYAFDAYYKNPRYLAKMDRLFGVETVRHIQEMTRFTLNRAHTQLFA
ncbi:MAG: radical SAM protein [Magnetococcus sp. YQC-9]